MFVYIFIFLILLFASIQGVKKPIMLAMIVILSLIAGFRENQIGVDTHNYVSYYNETSGIFEGYMEKGWNTIIVFCKLFGLSSYSCHFIVGLLTLIPFYIVAGRYKDKKLNGYVLFFLYSLCFYFLMFNGMRQQLAISLILMGYNSLSQGKIVRFFVWVLTASTIHLSSLLALPIFLVPRIRFTTSKVVLFLLTSFVLGIFLGEAFFTAVSGKYAHDVEDGLRIGLKYIMIVGLLTNLYTIWLYVQNSFLKDNFWVKCNIVSVIVLNLLTNLVIGPRVVYIFSITSIFAFSLYLKFSHNKLLHFIIYLYAIVMFVKFLVPEILIMGEDGSLVPYKMNFQVFAY